MSKEIFALTDRSDPKWAWPGPIQEGWKDPTPVSFFQTVIDHQLTPDDIKEGREMFEMGWEALLSEIQMPAELENAGEWRECDAPGCVEEPDAPPVKLRIRIPKERNGERLPVLLNIFSAGFAGKVHFFDMDAAIYSKETGCAVVTPQYRLHPENKFPAVINDLHAAYQWIIDNADEFGLDPDCIAVTGISAGGVFSLCLAHRLKRFGIIPRGIISLFPPVDDRPRGASSRIDYGGETLGCFEAQLAWPSLLGVSRFGLSCLTPEAVPNHATVDEVKGMPPIWMHVAEHDPLRDDEVEYCSKLWEAGVMCDLRVWAGTSHTTLFSGPPNEYKTRFNRQVYQNITDAFQYDLRRPWTGE